MPSSSKQSSGTIPSVQEWKPLDFQTASPVNRAASNSEPQAGGGAGNFVELVEIVKERISLAQNPVGEATGLATEEIQLWQPETLVAIANVTGNTHDHLRSREIIQQAEARLRQARIEAEQILAQAKGEAERILMEAREQANLIHRQAYADGQAAANAEAQGMLKVARAIVDEVQKWKENLFEEGEMMMLRLVIEIAQTIFGDGLPLDPDTLGQAFTRALSQAKSLGDLRIYLHPEDAAVLSAHWDKLQGVTAGQRVELIPSDMIKRGGCYIEGQYGTVDARVETQFQIATEALLTNLEKNRPG
jgi:flagellar assembly protein FliH